MTYPGHSYLWICVNVKPYYRNKPISSGYINLLGKKDCPSYLHMSTRTDPHTMIVDELMMKLYHQTVKPNQNQVVSLVSKKKKKAYPHICTWCPGALILKPMGHVKYTYLDVGITKSYHHIEQESNGCLGCLENACPLKKVICTFVGDRRWSLH